MLNITTYISGDWNGSNLTSTVDGTYWYIYVPSGVIVSGVYVKDSYNSGYLIDALSLTNTDGGHNFGWDFYSTPTGIIDRRIVLKKDISPILTNQRLTPYRIDSYDKLQAKLVLNIKGKKSFLSNVPVEFYLNYTNEFVKYVDATTDRNGIALIYLPCQNLDNPIDSCLGYANVTVDSVVYTSNTVRFNFVQGFAPEYELFLYPEDIMLYSSDIINI